MANRGRPCELVAALDEVERQLRAMPVQEVLKEEDLEWALGSVFVWAGVSDDETLTIELEAVAGGLWRRMRAARTITL